MHPFLSLVFFSSSLPFPADGSHNAAWLCSAWESARNWIRALRNENGNPVYTHAHEGERKKKPGVLLARAIYISRDRLTSFRMYTHTRHFISSLFPITFQYSDGPIFYVDEASRVQVFCCDNTHAIGIYMPAIVRLVSYFISSGIYIPKVEKEILRKLRHVKSIVVWLEGIECLALWYASHWRHRSFWCAGIYTMLVADVVVIFWTWRSSRRFLKVVVTQRQMERKKILQ